jgi:hypothetical protein
MPSLAELLGLTPPFDPDAPYSPPRKEAESGVPWWLRSSAGQPLPFTSASPFPQLSAGSTFQASDGSNNAVFDPPSAGLLGNHPAVRGGESATLRGILGDYFPDARRDFPGEIREEDQIGPSQFPSPDTGAPFRSIGAPLSHIWGMARYTPIATAADGQAANLANELQGLTSLAFPWGEAMQPSIEPQLFKAHPGSSPLRFDVDNAVDRIRPTGLLDDSQVISDVDPDVWIQGAQYANLRSRRGAGGPSGREISPPEWFRMALYNDLHRTLRELDPTNRQLESLNSPDWVPSNEDLSRLREEIHNIRRDRGLSELELHHMFPQQFRFNFNRARINIEDFTNFLWRDRHRLAPNGLHTTRDHWNAQWRRYFEENPDPTPEEIIGQLKKMLDQLERKRE